MGLVQLHLERHLPGIGAHFEGAVWKLWEDLTPTLMIRTMCRNRATNAGFIRVLVVGTIQPMCDTFTRKWLFNSFAVLAKVGFPDALPLAPHMFMWCRVHASRPAAIGIKLIKLLSSVLIFWTSVPCPDLSR